MPRLWGRGTTSRSANRLLLGSRFESSAIRRPKGRLTGARQIGFRMETSQEFGKAERAERTERPDL